MFLYYLARQLMDVLAALRANFTLKEWLEARLLTRFRR